VENLNSSKEQSSQQQSQTPNVDKLPDNVKAEAVDAARASAQLMDRATQHRPETQSDHANPGDGKEALIRNQGDQGKEQSAMSPTDHGKAQMATQERSQGRSRSMVR
jgi:hypothetical protein